MSKREITEHQVNECNRQIKLLSYPEDDSYLASFEPAPGEPPINVEIQFHVGNPADGVNGITIEVLLAIAIDRLRGHQAGPFKSRENACAITKLEEARMWLLERTRNREARGVEGSQTP